MNRIDDCRDSDPSAASFEEGICCNGKERQLEHKLTKQEGLEPHRGLLHQRVFELLRVPPQQVAELLRVEFGRQQRLQVDEHRDGDVRDEVEAQQSPNAGVVGRVSTGERASLEAVPEGTGWACRSVRI